VLLEDNTLRRNAVVSRWSRAGAGRAQRAGRGGPFL